LSSRTGHGAQVPSFSFAAESGSTVITREEFVQDIYAPTGARDLAFSVKSWYLNPGNELLMKWLSSLALSYEEYMLMQCTLTFKSTTGLVSNETSGQVGSVIMATAYNANSRVFQTKSEMMEYVGAGSGKITSTQQHYVECDPKKLNGHRGKYVRGSQMPGKDNNDFDHGLFQLAMANIPEHYKGAVLGELWVSYKVLLRKPRHFVGSGLAISTSLFNVPDLNLPAVPLATNSFQRLVGANVEVVNNGFLNSIPVKLIDYLGCLTFEFEPSYSGYIDVEFAVVSKEGVIFGTVGTVGGPAGVAVALINPLTMVVSDNVDVVNDGLITPYAPLNPVPDAATGYVYTFNADSSAAVVGSARSGQAVSQLYAASSSLFGFYTASSITVRVRIRILPATSGQRSLVLFAPLVTAATGVIGNRSFGGGAVKISRFTAQVREYNYGMSKAALGKGDSEEIVWTSE
jgi:hypothetical protein